MMMYFMHYRIVCTYMYMILLLDRSNGGQNVMNFISNTWKYIQANYTVVETHQLVLSLLLITYCTAQLPVNCRKNTGTYKQLLQCSIVYKKIPNDRICI
jgi:hypothetical protein